MYCTLCPCDSMRPDLRNSRSRCAQQGTGIHDGIISDTVRLVWKPRLWRVVQEPLQCRLCTKVKGYASRRLASVTYTNVDPKPPTGMHPWHKVSCGETV